MNMKRTKLMIAIAAAAVFFALAAGVYAANANITCQTAGEKTGTTYTSDVTLSYQVSDTDGLKKVQIKDGTVLLEEKICSGTAYAGEYVFTRKWLAEHEPASYQYACKIIAYDVNDNATTKAVSFEADASEPVVTITGVQEGKTYTGNKTVKIAMADSNLSSDTASLVIKKNGANAENLTSTDKINGHEYTSSGDGKYTVTASLKDKGQRQITRAMTFSVDSGGPVISGFELTGEKDASSGWFKSEVTVKAKATDTSSGIKKAVLTLNGSEAASEDYSGGEEENISLVVSKQFLSQNKGSDNHFTGTLTVTDEAGNSTEESVDFYADVDAPAVSISGVENNQIINSAPTITITGSDDSTVSVTATIKRNGQTVHEETAESVTYTPDADGNYSVSAYAKDNAGNISDTETVEFILDTAAPSVGDLALTGQIREGFSWYYGDVTVKTDLQDELSGLASMTMTVNGTTFDTKEYSRTSQESVTETISKSWIESHKSNNGKYDVAITAQDAAGNKTTKEISFYADTIPPQVTYAGTEDGAITNQTPTSSARIEDEYGGIVDFTVEHNGSVIRHSNDKDQETFIASSDGTYKITAKAIDKAGNESETKTVTYMYDTVPPQISPITFSGPINPGFTWFKSDVTASADLSDEFTGLDQTEMIVNGKTVTDVVYGGSLAETLQKTLNRQWFKNNESKDGAYLVVVKTKDRAGNESSLFNRFFADVVTPSVTLSGIDNGTYTQTNPTITATVKDNYPEKNTVRYTVYRNGKQVYDTSKKGEKTSIKVFDKDGDYEIVATATDLAGNTSATAKKTFTRDTVAPVISLTGAKNGQYYNTAKTITARVKERNYKNMTVSSGGSRTIDGKKSAASMGKITPTRSDYKKNVRFKTNGTYILTLSAVDKAGNRARPVKLSFTVDTVKPEIKISGFRNENGYDAVVAPKITFSDSYFASRSISLKKTGKTAENLHFRDAKTKKGGSRTYSNFDKSPRNDGIYGISCTVKDKAGNTATVNKIFKVNRYGSTFRVANDSKEIKGSYRKELLTPITITEKNVTGLKKYEVVVTKDGVKLNDPKVKVKASTAQTGEKVYKYTISPENFVDEGAYQVNVVSEDTLGNFSELSEDGNNFRFFIDKTPPTISVAGIEEGGSYESGEKLATVSVNDAIALSGYKVYSNGDLIYDMNDQENPAKTATIDIPGGVKQTISVSAMDRAGNSSSFEVKDVTVSGNAFARALSGGKGPILGGGAAAILAGLAALFFIRRKRTL